MDTTYTTYTSCGIEIIVLMGNWVRMADCVG